MAPTTPVQLKRERSDTLFRIRGVGTTFVGVPVDGGGPGRYPNGMQGPTFAEGYVCVVEPQTGKLLSWFELDGFERAAKEVGPAPELWLKRRQRRSRPSALAHA